MKKVPLELRVEESKRKVINEIIIITNWILFFVTGFIFGFVIGRLN